MNSISTISNRGLPSNPASEEDFYYILRRTLQSIQSDPAQLRNAIYELARVKLQKECFQRDKPLSVLETRRLMLALETAIERAETMASQQEIELLGSISHSQRPSSFGLTPEAVPLEVSPVSSPVALPPTSNWRWRLCTALLLLWCVAMPVLLFATGSGEGLLQRSLSTRSTQLPAAIVAEPPPQNVQAGGPASSGEGAGGTSIALPTAYGVYAVSDGQLYELDALPGRAPDPRVSISAAITRPSRTTLPGGQISFIVFRRDLASSTADRLSIRVIARVMRAMSFDKNGQAKIHAVDDTWAIRSNTFYFRISPSGQNPDMLFVRPEDPDFTLSPGRYGLVLKDQAYDFTVAGSISDPDHCLERVEANNGSFFSICRRP